MWLGYGFNRNCAHFINRHYVDYASDADHKEGMIRVSGVQWFTNLDITKRHEELILHKKYHPDHYPQYDNYNAIEVEKTVDIPMDYEGAMGVPITFLNKFNPEQFEILGTSDRGGDNIPEIDAIRLTVKKMDSCLVNGKKVYKRLFIKHKAK
jgi:hypothetical protein